MSIVRRWTPALLTLALVGPASAQAPLVTAAGDPSVDDDSIYALVVDPADYPEDAAIRLLDDGIVRIADDGTYLETYRTVVQVLRQEAVDGWSTFTYTIRPDVERYRLNWVRVLRADGTLISDQPLHYQENDVGGGDGMYVDQTQIDFELAGVGVGAIIDYSYTVETYAPILEGDLYLSWGITTGTPVRRSRYILEAPQATRLRIEERNPPAPATVTVHDGAVTRTWAYADLETIEPELFAADSANPYSSLAISGDVSWAEIGAWFAGLARGRTTVDHSLAAVLDSVTRGHAGADAIEALHRWVAQDIRYVSLSLGIGGYQPRLPAEVVRTLAGDCKDKAMLFVVGARRLGYEAYPVLVSSGGWADRDHPSIGQFDHAIAAFRRGEEPWRYVDLTADLVPHGEIPGGLQGSFGLLVRDDGAVEEVELPNTQVFENTKYSEMAGELLPDGSFRGRYRERAEGFPGFAMRGWIPLPLGASEKREAAQVVARSLFPAATGDSLIAYVGRDWNQPTDLQLHFRVPELVQDLGGGRYLLNIPVHNYGRRVKSLISQLQEDSIREFAIDAGQVSGEMQNETVLELTLPEGWTAELPPAVHVTGDLGEYRATYTQEGRVLRISRAMNGAERVFGKERMSDLRAWLQAVAADDRGALLIQAP